MLVCIIGSILIALQRRYSLRDLPSKELIVIIGNIIFFGLLICIWCVAKVFPAWNARQIARQEQIRKERLK